MKAQTILIQFVIFFVISVSILGAISYFFRMQADFLKEDISENYRSLLNSYLSASTISLMTCNCNGSIKFSVPTTTAEEYTEIFFVNNQSLIVSQPSGKSSISLLHNLNYTLLFEGYAHSARLINLTLEKGKIILGVSS